MTRVGLVLGAGGVVGQAYHAGVLAVLEHDVGFDPRSADLIVGTSAGAAVGAFLALGLDPSAVLGAVASLGAVLDPGQVAAAARALFGASAQTAGSASPEEGLRELGRLAAGAETVGEEQVLTALARLDGQAWPGTFACTAIDAESGAFRVWDAGAGVPLDRAVASSLAAPLVLPLVTIGGRRYMDGGLLSPLNADLAAGRERVVAVSCFPLAAPAGTPDPAALVAQAAELDAVRERAEAVAVIEPGGEFLALSGGGANLLDTGRAGAAYDAGLRQARAELDRVRAVWDG